MEQSQSPDYSPAATTMMPMHGDPSRPSLGFPLGTALLLLVIFTLSGVFSCCYHWDRLRAIRGGGASMTESVDEDIESGADATKSYMIGKDQKVPAVIMPGDNVPKFIALPSPCEPPRPEDPDKHVIRQPTRPPKPPPLAIPLYV
ncbi:hypothetical protein Droror1_Dr00011049 [Drosera rotundifolia]